MLIVITVVRRSRVTADDEGDQDPRDRFAVGITDDAELPDITDIWEEASIDCYGDSRRGGLRCPIEVAAYDASSDHHSRIGLSDHGQETPTSILTSDIICRDRRDREYRRYSRASIA
jgi:hypothetical protein